MGIAPKRRPMRFTPEPHGRSIRHVPGRADIGTAMIAHRAQHGACLIDKPHLGIARQCRGWSFAKNPVNQQIMSEHSEGASMEEQHEGRIAMLEAQIAELSARIGGGNSAVFSLIQIVCHALETRGLMTRAEIAEAVSRCANITAPDAKDRAQVIGQALLTGVAVQLGGPKENLASP